jgi:beta-RFAP synthase
MSFGRSDVRQFGGVGVMIDTPAVKLRLSAAADLQVTGPSAAQTLRYVESVAQAEWFGRRPRCHIEVLSMPNPHVGLGSGTQLALAVVAGLNALYDRTPLTAEQLAGTVARGRRSAVGLYGFLQGGLIFEAGKLAEDEISPLVSRVPIPEPWRFLLVRPTDGEGLSGDAERVAFDRVPPVPADATARMCHEAAEVLVPAATSADFQRFSESLSRFGREAGSCFAPLQGGIYASGRISQVADALAALGIVGVGQSSWGPTVFAMLPNQQAAENALRQFAGSEAARAADCLIARPMNRPAHIEVRSE